MMLQAKQVLQGRYQLTEQLATNAGRQTWLATDLETENLETVIVKLLAFSPQMQWEELKLFEREGVVLKNLHHPRVPKYRDYFSVGGGEVSKEISEMTEKEHPLPTFEDSGLPWFGLVQDYIAGASLQQLLKQGKHFTEAQVHSYAEQILNILIYLHELSPPVLHRDIKPSNLILGEDRQIYLVDFGAVQDKAKAEGATFTVVGTGGYAPPEQLWGKAVPASDLYALGATLIHLLTGTAPADLPQQNMRIQFSDRLNLTPHFTSWIQKLVEPASERRYSTAREALEALRSPTTKANSQPANNSVRYGRLIFLTSLQLFIVVGSAFSILPNFLSHHGADKAKQSEAKTYVGSMNRAQQANFTEQKAFTNSIEKLGLGIKTQTINYNYSTQATKSAAFSYGIARNDSLKSYVGGVFLVPATKAAKDEVMSVRILCEANSSGTNRPAEPVRKNGEAVCGAGTHDLDKK